MLEEQECWRVEVVHTYVIRKIMLQLFRAAVKFYSTNRLFTYVML